MLRYRSYKGSTTAIRGCVCGCVPPSISTSTSTSFTPLATPTPPPPLQYRDLHMLSLSSGCINRRAKGHLLSTRDVHVANPPQPHSRSHSLTFGAATLQRHQPISTQTIQSFTDATRISAAATSISTFIPTPTSASGEGNENADVVSKVKNHRVKSNKHSSNNSNSALDAVNILEWRGNITDQHVETYNQHLCVAKTGKTLQSKRTRRVSEPRSKSKSDVVKDGKATANVEANPATLQPDASSSSSSSLITPAQPSLWQRVADKFHIIKQAFRMPDAVADSSALAAAAKYAESQGTPSATTAPSTSASTGADTPSTYTSLSHPKHTKSQSESPPQRKRAQRRAVKDALISAAVKRAPYDAEERVIEEIVKRRSNSSTPTVDLLIQSLTQPQAQAQEPRETVTERETQIGTPPLPSSGNTREESVDAAPHPASMSTVSISTSTPSRTSKAKRESPSTPKTAQRKSTSRSSTKQISRLRKDTKKDHKDATPAASTASIAAATQTKSNADSKAAAAEQRNLSKHKEWYDRSTEFQRYGEALKGEGKIRIQVDRRSMDDEALFSQARQPPRLASTLRQAIFPNNQLYVNPKHVVAGQSTSVFMLDHYIAEKHNDTLPSKGSRPDTDHNEVQDANAVDTAEVDQRVDDSAVSNSSTSTSDVAATMSSLSNKISSFVHIPSTGDIDYNKIPPFTPPSRDVYLLERTSAYEDVKFIGSTSSISSLLMHFHYNLLQFRPIELQYFSPVFQMMSSRHSTAARKPISVLLKKLKVPARPGTNAVKNEAASGSSADTARDESADPTREGQRSEDMEQKVRCVWSIDNPPQFSVKSNQVLIDLGKVFERQLTMEPERFKQLIRSGTEGQKEDVNATNDAVTDQENTKDTVSASASASTSAAVPPSDSTSSFAISGVMDTVESEGNDVLLEEDTNSASDTLMEDGLDSHSYMKYRSMLIRAQLDCYDDAVPDQMKIFDLKSRATLPIRLDCVNYHHYTDYHIRKIKGELNSFEREYYDMARSSFLKYSMQCRLGNMSGILVGYHNTQRIFGLQYIPLSDMNRILFGNQLTADVAFSYSMKIMNNTFAAILSHIKMAYYENMDSDVDTMRITMNTKDIDVQTEIWVEVFSRKNDPQSSLPFIDRYSAPFLVSTLSREEIVEYLTQLDARFDLNASDNILSSQLEELLADRSATTHQATHAYYKQAMKEKRLFKYVMRNDMFVAGQKIQPYTATTLESQNAVVATRMAEIRVGSQRHARHVDSHARYFMKVLDRVDRISEEDADAEEGGADEEIDIDTNTNADTEQFDDDTIEAIKDDDNDNECEGEEKDDISDIFKVEENNTGSRSRAALPKFVKSNASDAVYSILNGDPMKPPQEPQPQPKTRASRRRAGASYASHSA